MTRFTAFNVPQNTPLSVAEEPPATLPFPQNDTPEGDPGAAGHPFAAGHFACRFVLLLETTKETLHLGLGFSTVPLIR